MYYVYLTTNLLNGKIYIGQRKYRDCLPDDDKYLGSGSILHRSIKKYGRANFKKTILHYNIETQAETDLLEIFEIANHNSLSPNGYNLSKGGRFGGGGSKGFKHSEETKRKQRIKALERWKDPEYIQKRKETFCSPKGRKYSKEICQRVSDRNKGHTVSEETKRKISEKLKGIPLSEETKQKMKGRIPWNKGKKTLTKKNIKS